MSNYNKQELVKIIKDYANKIGKTPKMNEVAKNPQLPTIWNFLKLFGTWNNVLKSAGLKINAIGEYSPEELINLLKQIAKKLGRTPRIEDLIKNKDSPSANTYFRVFGSWNNALIKAGLKINVKKGYTNKELLELLKILANKLKRTPIMDDMTKAEDFPDANIYKERFGSWNKALEAAGLKVKYRFRKWTKDQIITWLQEKEYELGRTPGIRDFDKDPDAPCKNTVRKLFGNWTNAIRKAGLRVTKHHTKEELIRILKRVAKKLNRTPTREELKKRKDCPSYIPFVEKFGSYTAACLRAGLIPNDGRNNQIWQAWEKHCIKMAKIIYHQIEIKNKELVNGVPDIYIPKEKLFIDAKTCGYRDFKPQIKNYCSDGHKLEFWCIFKGLETKNPKVKYVYAEELAKLMFKKGREDLASKCYQFIRNIYSDNQRLLKDFN